MIKEIKIKFDTKLNQNKIVGNHNFTNVFIYIQKKKKKLVYIHLLTWLHVTLNRHYGKK